MKKVSLGETGDTAPTGRVRTQGGGNVLQGGGTRDISVWFGDLGPFGRNGEECRRGTHGIPQTDHGEASESDSRRDVGYARAEVVREAAGP